MPWLVRWVLVSVIVPYAWKRREVILRLVGHMLGVGPRAKGNKAA